MAYEKASDKRASQQQIKASNLNLLLNLLNKNEPVSRAKLAEMTSLSPTTVSSLVEGLIQHGLVLEAGLEEAAGLGRKAIQLNINRLGAYAACVEMVESGFHAGLYDLKCECIAQSFTHLEGFSQVGEAMADAINGLLVGNGAEISRLAGICVAVPGLVDGETQCVTASTVIQIDPDNPFARILAEAFPTALVLVGNESSFCAYSEVATSMSQGIRDLILVDINTGVGSGIIVDGRIFTGAMGIAGELGHVTVDLNGPKCKCGSRGCLEVVASVPALMSRAVSAVTGGKGSILNRLCGGDPAGLTLESVAQALAAGDSVCTQIAADTARYLAFGLNSAINLINPQAIILSGQITVLGEPFLNLLRKHLEEIAFKFNMSRLILRFTTLQNNAALDGGTHYVLDRLFSSGSLVDDLVK